MADPPPNTIRVYIRVALHPLFPFALCAAVSLSDFIYRPFETLIRPLDLPYAPTPARGAFALLLHFLRLFRGALAVIALFSMAVEGINLAVIWGISVIVDGVSAKGAAVFLQQDWRMLAVIGALVFPVMPLFAFVANTLNSQVVAVCMPAAIQWESHKAVERQDLAFFHDLFAGQVATRISQVASAVQQQIVVAFQIIPHFLVHIGALVLLGVLSWRLHYLFLAGSRPTLPLRWRYHIFRSGLAGQPVHAASLSVP